MTQPKGYVDTRYLDALARPLAPAKKRTYELMRIRPGHHVLDAGCGPGTDTIDLAALVGAAGKVVGVDYDPAMLAEADRRAEQAGVCDRVEHKQADATSLPFEAGSFDSCRSERLFQHLLEPAKALSEMARVTRPGGWIVVLDTDHGSISLDTDEIDIERRLFRFQAERCLNNGYSGRRLYRLFKRQGLVDLQVEMFPIFTTDFAIGRYMSRLDVAEREALAAGVITQEELDRWRASLERAGREGVLFGSASMVLVAGRKPSPGNRRGSPQIKNSML
jgi:ubiquinone/menaquinone biosynthesis C-methylase UbiE